MIKVCNSRIKIIKYQRISKVNHMMNKLFQAFIKYYDKKFMFYYFNLTKISFYNCQSIIINIFYSNYLHK